MSSLLYMAKCPAHDDDTPSFAVYDDMHGHCFTCGHHDNRLASVVVPVERVKKGRYEGPLPWSMVEEYEKQLHTTFHSRLGWLWGRGLRSMTVEKLHLGHTGKAFSLPVWDGDGSLLTVRYRRDDKLAEASDPKYKSLAGAKRTLYGLWQEIRGRVVVLTEGELDAALLMQEFWRHSLDNFVALSVTGGAGGLTPDLVTSHLSRADYVLLAYDQDLAGREGSARAMGCLWDNTMTADVNILRWPQEWGKDVTDAMKTVGPAVWLERVLGRWL